MFGVRILGVATAYSVILLEVYSGAIKGPHWWIYPGALVIALLMSLSLFAFTNQSAPEPQRGPIAVMTQWILILGTSFAMAAFANYFGRELLPDMLANLPVPPAN